MPFVFSSSVQTAHVRSMPLHFLLAESILCHGGSLELVRILNRVGAVASLDTCNRLATFVVDQRIRRGITLEFEPNKLTVISIDNIDIMQTHAMVSCLDATRSVHGASVQAVQPLPKSATITPSEQFQPVSRKHPAISPPVTPPVHKHKRRHRTITEQTSPTCASLPKRSFSEVLCRVLMSHHLLQEMSCSLLSTKIRTRKQV